MNQKRISLIIAGTLALATGFLTLNYLSSVRSASSTSAGQQRYVVVAAQDIPARVTITRAMLKPARRDAAQIEPNAILDPSKVVGSYALIAIPAGASVTASELGRPQNLGLSAVLQPGMRAVSIGIDSVKGVSDLIQPGDRVDVISVAARTGAQTPAAATILRGALVLALGSSLQNTAPVTTANGQNIATVTLGVTPSQADLLVSADINSTLRLALRSPKEPTNSLPAQPFVLPAVQSEPLSAAQALQTAASRATPRRVLAPGIQVIDGNGGPG